MKFEAGGVEKNAICFVAAFGVLNLPVDIPGNKRFLHQSSLHLPAVWTYNL